MPILKIQIDKFNFCERLSKKEFERTTCFAKRRVFTSVCTSIDTTPRLETRIMLSSQLMLITTLTPRITVWCAIKGNALGRRSERRTVSTAVKWSWNLTWMKCHTHYKAGFNFSRMQHRLISLAKCGTPWSLSRTLDWAWGPIELLSVLTTCTPPEDCDCAETCRSKINSKIHNIYRMVHLLVSIEFVIQFTMQRMTIWKRWIEEFAPLVLFAMRQDLRDTGCKVGQTY